MSDSYFFSIGYDSNVLIKLIAENRKTATLQKQEGARNMSGQTIKW